MAVFPIPALAQTGPSDALQRRADDIVRLLKGEAIEQEVFNANFLNAVPPAQFRALAAQLTAQHGEPLAIEAITATGPNDAVVEIRFARSIGTVNLSVEAQPPHLISGLFITGFEAQGEDLAAVVAAIDALPGRQGLLIQPLDGAAAPLAAIDADGRLSIASAFKLYILAELDRAVRAGERRWSDVVTLGPKSHPSGISQNWPDEAPVTLHTLATLMISVSDNTATDTLIRVIGQERLAAILRETGHHDPDDMAPILMTRQSSALKMPAQARLRADYLAADERVQRRLLAENDARLSLDGIDFALLTTGPREIDTLGWHATPADMVRLLDWLRRHASERTRAILAVNPGGIGAANASQWSYLGYKGGSETGVFSANYLAKASSGRWYAVSVVWNNPDAPVVEGDIWPLITRALTLVAGP